MVNRIDMYDEVAGVLTYPDESFEDRLAGCGEALRAAGGDFEERFGAWADQMRGLCPADRQEIYARTFDLSPKCTLEIGWHLFGESYDRGTFLVWMRGQLRGFALAESTDLPDHVRHVLPVLGRMEPEAADAFSTACVQPALETIRDGLDGLDSPYRPLIDAICVWLASHHGVSLRDPRALPVLCDQHEELLRAETL